MSAAEHHGQVVRVQQPADHRAQLGLARLELARGVVVAAVHGHVARVHERARALEVRERGERAAQRLRAVLGSHAAVVPAHALVRGEADERRGPRARRRSAGAGVALRRRGLAAAVGGADDLVPAQVLGGVTVGAAGPGGGEGRGGELGGHGTIPRHRRAGAQRRPDDARHGASPA